MTVLDRSWKNCLRMWKWISENLSDGFMKLDFNRRRMVVYALKEKWMKKHYHKSILFRCFFCHYDHNNNNNGSPSCANCPAKKVERRLGSHWCEHKYHWFMNPVNFYQYLLKLDAKRKSTK